MKRLGRQDWIAEGFKILSEFAQNKIRILYLCERLKVTRGSFYHHFDGIDQYIDALLMSWEQENTQALIEAAEKGNSPSEKMQILDQLVFEKDNAVEAAIRSWSFYNDAVGKHLKKVDEKRLQYLINIFLESGRSEHKARMLAKLEYATLIGIQQLHPGKFDEEIRQIYALHSQMIAAVE